MTQDEEAASAALRAQRDGACNSGASHLRLLYDRLNLTADAVDRYQSHHPYLGHFLRYFPALASLALPLLLLSLAGLIDWKYFVGVMEVAVVTYLGTAVFMGRRVSRVSRYPGFARDCAQIYSDIPWLVLWLWHVSLPASDLYDKSAEFSPMDTLIDSLWAAIGIMTIYGFRSYNLPKKYSIIVAGILTNHLLIVLILRPTPPYSMLSVTLLAVSYSILFIGGSAWKEARCQREQYALWNLATRAAIARVAREDD